MSPQPTDKLQSIYRDHIEILTQRFTAAITACCANRVLVFAGSPHQIDRDDQHHPFRVNPYFAQWLPLIQAPGSVIELRAGQKPHLIIAQARDFWHETAGLPPGPWIPHFDISITEPDRVEYQLGQPSQSTLLVGECTIDATALNTVDNSIAINMLDYDRAIKTEYEISCIQFANNSAVRGHLAVEANFDQAVSEFDLHIRYCHATGHTDAELPYPNIIGLNEHASILHYQNLRREPPAESRSLLIDAGANYSGYAADITRSYALEAGRFADLIAGMHRLQKRVCTMVKPGIEFIELNRLTHQLLAELLVEHELLSCTADDAFDRGITRYFMPHGLGHLLGLQVHDIGGKLAGPEGDLIDPPSEYPFLRLTRRIEPGFVLTIEPGVYFIQSLIEQMDKKAKKTINFALFDELLPYGGIRIEDNVQVELRGHRNITREAFAKN